MSFSKIIPPPSLARQVDPVFTRTNTIPSYEPHQPVPPLEVSRNHFLKQYLDTRDGERDWEKTVSHVQNTVAGKNTPEECIVFPPLFVLYNGHERVSDSQAEKKDYFSLLALGEHGQLYTLQWDDVGRADVILHFYGRSGAIVPIVCHIEPEKFDSMKFVHTTLYSIPRLRDHDRPNEERQVSVEEFFELYQRRRLEAVAEVKRRKLM